MPSVISSTSLTVSTCPHMIMCTPANTHQVSQCPPQHAEAWSITNRTFIEENTSMQEANDRTGLDQTCSLWKTNARILFHAGVLGTRHADNGRIAFNAMCRVSPLQLPRLLPSNASMRLLMIWPFWKISASTVDVHASMFVLCILLQQQEYSAMSIYYKNQLLCRHIVTCMHRLQSLLW